jgi:hypothetical protein
VSTPHVRSNIITKTDTAGEVSNTHNSGAACAALST